MKPRWKRAGNDGEVETTHKGKTWRVRKNYDHNDRHTGEYRIEIKKKNPYGGHDWHWHDTVYGKAHAKSRLPESVQPHPDVVKAYKKTQDAEHKHGEYGTTATKRAVTRTSNTLSKKIKQHHPDLDMKGKIAIRTKLQNMNEEVAAVNTGSIPDPAKTAMGPSRLPIHILRRNVGKPINMTDRRRRKDKHPVLLKRFRNYING